MYPLISPQSLWPAGNHARAFLKMINELQPRKKKVWKKQYVSNSLREALTSWQTPVWRRNIFNAIFWAWEFWYSHHLLITTAPKQLLRTFFSIRETDSHSWKTKIYAEHFSPENYDLVQPKDFVALCWNQSSFLTVTKQSQVTLFKAFFFLTHILYQTPIFLAVQTWKNPTLSLGCIKQFSQSQTVLSQ